MNEWNIQSRGRVCETCGKTFADQETYHTLLFDEKRDFRRQDVCGNCWQTQFSEGARERKGFVSYWHGVYEAPAPAHEAIQKETAETVLRKLIALNDPKHVPAGFILAVMLERKRILKVKEQFVRDGRRVFVYEHPASGDLFTIVDPALHLDQLEQVQRDVADLLEHGLNPPAAEATLPSDVERAHEPSPHPSPLPSLGGSGEGEELAPGGNDAGPSLREPSPHPPSLGSYGAAGPSPLPSLGGSGEGEELQGSGVQSAKSSGNSLPQTAVS